MKPHERFDRLILPDEQAAWLAGKVVAEPFNSTYFSGTETSAAANEFRLLTDDSNYFEVLEFLRFYAEQFLPFPMRTTQKYWVSTCKVEAWLQARLSVADQAVLDIIQADDISFVRWTLNTAVLGEGFDTLCDELDISRENWGHQRVAVGDMPLTHAYKIMEHPSFAHTVRRCNLWLMRRRLCVFRQAHNRYLAAAILDTRDFTHQQELFPTSEFEDEVRYESEGKISSVQAQRRSRSYQLVAEKKRIFQTQHNGQLFCEICGFDFAQFYDDSGDGIEVHHLHPLSACERLTTLEELILVCPNCHRMLHTRTPMYEPDELRQLIHRAANPL